MQTHIRAISVQANATVILQTLPKGNQYLSSANVSHASSEVPQGFCEGLIRTLGTERESPLCDMKSSEVISKGMLERNIISGDHIKAKSFLMSFPD